MTSKFPVKLLRALKSGSLKISEDGKKFLELTSHSNKKIINITDFSFNIPINQGIFTKLSEAKEFAEALKDQKLTLCISHKDKMVMKLGQEANPKLSRLFTRSKAVEIINLRELRRLDKRLRLK